MKHAMFLPGGPPARMIEWARRIESAGFDSIWQGEFVNSALIPLAAIAPATTRIKLGAGVVLAFTQSPVMLTFAALDLDYLSGGRFTLGLGVAHPNRNNNWYGGHDAGKPVSQMREYLEVVRLITDRSAAGGQIEYEGKYYHVRARDFTPRRVNQPRPRFPIYVAGVKPKMATLAGELADGLIGNPMFSPRYVRDHVVPSVSAGLAKSNRKRPDFEILGQCFTVIENDLATAYRLAARAFMFSIWARIYDDIMIAEGFGDVVNEARALNKSGKAEAALDRIPREMVDAFWAVGPIDRVRERIRAREGLLDTVILTVPSTQTTTEEQDHYRNRILEAFGA
jgi:probable F420-dependent oxidoreductase